MLYRSKSRDTYGKWVFSILIALFLSAGTALGDDLQSLTDTAEYRRLNRLTHQGQVTQLGDQWGRFGANYSQLFEHRDGGKILTRWIGISSTDYPLVRSGQKTHVEYVEAYRIFRTKENEEISQWTLVPHPRHRDKIEFGLVTAFEQLKPPKLKVVTKEKMKIGEFPATLYYTKSGKCSLRIELARGAIVNVAGPKALEQTIMKLANALTLEQLNQKLLS